MAKTKGQGGEPEAEKNDAQNQPDPGEEMARQEREQVERSAAKAVEQKREMQEAPKPDPRDVTQEPDPSATMDRRSPDEKSDDAAERERAVADPAVPGQPPGAVYPDRAV